MQSRNSTCYFSLCGIHSHIFIVSNGHSEYIQDVTWEVNETAFHSVTLAGSITPNRYCTGTQFSDPYGTWNNVVVQAIFKITLQENYVTIHLNSNKIQLGSGIIFTLSDTFCTDVEYGQTFWNILPKPTLIQC